MKITVYSTSDCSFSKQEKDYLTSKGIQFEEKNIQTNREFLTEMLSVSDNFAGTPVTKIEKDDGQSTVLKGFTQSDFENVFASNVQAVNATIPKPATDDQTQTPPAPEPVEPPVETPIPPVETPNPEPVVETPVPEPVPDETPVEPTVPEPVIPEPTAIPEPTPVEPTPPSPEPVMPEPTPTTPPVEQPVTQPKTDEALSSILDSLKTKSEEPNSPTTPTATA